MSGIELGIAMAVIGGANELISSHSAESQARRQTQAEASEIATSQRMARGKTLSTLYQTGVSPQSSSITNFLSAQRETLKTDAENWKRTRIFEHRQRQAASRRALFQTGIDVGSLISARSTKKVKKIGNK